MEKASTAAALRNYHARMQRALEHIEQHLDSDLDLDLDAVSRVAAFSKFHFHRQFTATFGLSVHRYVQLARMKRASYRLAYRDADSVTAIALDAGYDAPDAFARAFRQRFGQSPSSFRKAPDWAPWQAAFGPLDHARSQLMRKTFDPGDVAIRHVPPTPVAILEHRGDPATLGASIQRFIAWRQAHGLPPRTHPTFNVWRSERRPASPADYAVDLCVGTAGRALAPLLLLQPPLHRRRADEARRNTRGPLRRAARRRPHRQPGACRAVPLPTMAAHQRRRGARLSAVLPAAELFSRGVGGGGCG